MPDQSKLRIGIIGAGNIGGTLTRRLTSLGHAVVVTNSRGPATLAKLASETGAKAVTVEEAARGRDIVVVTIPQKNIPDLPTGLFEGEPNELVVIDTGNYYPRLRDGRIAEIEDGMPESRWVEKHLGRPVVKAFNNIHAEHLLKNGKPPGATGRIALPVAGDDPAAKEVVLRLVDELGFDGVDAGGLGESWRQQPDTPVYGTNYDAENVRLGLAQASPERKPEWRA
jgi:8-hydroxy-5-deazaflavin:NADPH oxidoreductase